MARSLVWNNVLVRKFWDHHSGRPEQYFGEQFGRNIVLRTKNFFPGGTILDYGCGSGGLIGPLLETGGRVTGADISQTSIAEVNRRFSGNPNFVKATPPRKLIATKEKFSTVVLSEVVEHLEDAELQEVFTEIKALISRGGVLIVTTPNNEILQESLVYCPNCDVEFHRWQHVRTWSAKTLSAYMNSVGFATITVLETNFEDPPGLKAGLKRVLKKILKRNFSPHLVIVAQSS